MTSPSRPPRILVVDDEPRNRKLLMGYLADERYRVSEAGDGAGALECAHRELPDVILLDVMMPEMTGHEVCRRLKDDPRTRGCQIMMVTALAGEANTVEGLDTGADDYVSKPVRREEFLAKVRSLVRASNLVRELDAARRSLAARNAELELKKTLAQTLVHDLKSPLTAILANLDLMRLGGDTRHTQVVERSRRSGDRMLNMILNLLDIERLEEGQLDPARVPTDLAALARAAVEEAATPGRSQGIRLEIHAPEAAWCLADPGLLRRVLDNLVSNAIGHSPRDSAVRVAVENRAEGVCLAVTDSGPGVPEELREEVFEKYRKAGPAVTGSALNRGLGLTFCRMVVEAHGGTIWIDAGPEGGAAFHTLLPDAPAEEVAAQGSGAATVAVGP